MTRISTADLTIEARPNVYLRLPPREQAAGLLKKQAAPPFKITFATPADILREGPARVVRYGLHDTPLGPALIAITAEGICGTGFAVGKAEDLLHNFLRKWPRATLIEDVKATAPWAKKAYGKTPGKLPLFMVGNAFHQRVWRLLLNIPRHTLARYGDLAAVLGKPNAARAVGNAVGANPVSWLVPCHRVCHANGGLTGFGWGEDCKRDFLAYEH